MMSGAIFALMLAGCYAGWSLLSVAMPRHQRPLLGHALRPGAARWARIAGWLVLLASFALGVAAGGWEFGPVAWACAWMLSALAWVLLLPFAPRWALRLAWMAPVAAGLALALG